MARLGAFNGVLVFLFLSWIQGHEWWAVLLTVLANFAAFALVAWIDQRRAGQRRLVLIHHLGAAAIATASIGFVSGVGVTRLLDSWAPAVLVLLFFGRLGCFLVGCCHGHVARWGTWYSFRARGPLRRVAGQVISVVPVQLVEAVALGGLAAATGYLTTVEGADGVAMAVLLAGYGAVRFATELLRGDARPYWGSLSQAQLQSSALVGCSALLSIQAGLVGGAMILITTLGALVTNSLGRPSVLVFRERSLALFRERLLSGEQDLDGLRPALQQLGRGLMGHSCEKRESSSSTS